MLACVRVRSLVGVCMRSFIRGLIRVSVGGLARVSLRGFVRDILFRLSWRTYAPLRPPTAFRAIFL